MGIWMSWSAFKQYKRTCGKQYKYQRIDKKDPPKKDSRHNAIVGTVVQDVFEDFYNDELWRRKDNTSQILLERTDKYFWEYLDNNYINFDDVTCRYDSKTEPLKECLEIIPKTLEGIKREKFLGPYAKSEVNLKVRFGPKDFLVGYLDFVIRRANDEVLIIDGKSSRHREKYVDEDQLYFYALMFYLRYKTLPDKLGFLYYRFADDPEEAVDWLPVKKSKIKELKLEIEDAIYDIKQRKFPANPHYSHCQWCQYEQICDERMAQKRDNRIKRQKNSKKKKIDTDFTDGKANIGFNDLK